MEQKSQVKNNNNTTEYKRVPTDRRTPKYSCQQLWRGPTVWPYDRQYDPMTNSMNDCMTVWLYDRQYDPMTDSMTVWTTVWPYERLYDSMTLWPTVWPYDCMTVWQYDCINHTHASIKRKWHEPKTVWVTFQNKQ